MEDLTTIKNIIDDITPAEYICARIIAACFPHRFRYSGNKSWQYYNTLSGEWHDDKGKKQLKRCIQTEFTAILMQRAKVWQEHLQTDGHSDHETVFRVMRMMDISRKLQTKDYLQVVIKELAEWYNGDE